MLRTLVTIVYLFLSATTAVAEIYQISNGIRVMMNSSKVYDQQRKTNPNYPSYVVHSQPIIESVLPKSTSLRFAGHTELLTFFSNISPSVKEKGLWITYAGSKDIWNQSDIERISALTEGAKKLDILMFVCTGKTAKRKATWLVAWECNMESPKKGSQLQICEPKDNIDPSGPPLWDCIGSSR